jgi:hypothetical protein
LPSAKRILAQDAFTNSTSATLSPFRKTARLALAADGAARTLSTLLVTR